MGISQGAIRLGIAKQSAKGTLVAQPTFMFGVGSGSGIVPNVNQKTDPQTSGNVAPTTVYRSDAVSPAKIDYRAHLKSLGLLLLGANGAVATTGTDPYTHVFTLAAAKPYLSVYEELSLGGDCLAVRDCKVNKLTLKWDKNDPLQVIAELLGTVLSFPASVTAGTDETGLTTNFTPVGGTFKLDVDSATPVVASIKGGEVVLENKNRGEHYCGAIEPSDVSDGNQDASCSFTVVPDDYGQWRTLLTGTTSGAGITASPVYGSFEMTFVSGAASLKLEASKVPFMCDLPTAEPDATGSAETPLAGPCLYSATLVACVKATLINAQATY